MPYLNDGLGVDGLELDEGLLVDVVKHVVDDERRGEGDGEAALLQVHKVVLLDGQLVRLDVEGPAAHGEELGGLEGEPHAVLEPEAPHGDAVELGVDDAEGVDHLEGEGHGGDVLHGDVLQEEGAVQTDALEGLGLDDQVLDLKRNREYSRSLFFSF